MKYTRNYLYYLEQFVVCLSFFYEKFFFEGSLIERRKIVCNVSGSNDLSDSCLDLGRVLWDGNGSTSVLLSVRTRMSSWSKRNELSAITCSLTDTHLKVLSAIQSEKLLNKLLVTRRCRKC